MNVLILVMIPFLGTSLGAACVFLFKNSINDSLQRMFTGFAAGVMVSASFPGCLHAVRETMINPKRTGNNNFFIVISDFKVFHELWC